MSFLHRYFVEQSEDLFSLTVRATISCMECGARFVFEMDKISIREAMLNPHRPHWPMQVMADEMSFLNANLPCIYPEPNA